MTPRMGRRVDGEQAFGRGGRVTSVERGACLWATEEVLCAD